MENKQTTKHFH